MVLFERGVFSKCLDLRWGKLQHGNIMIGGAVKIALQRFRAVKWRRYTKSCYIFVDDVFGGAKIHRALRPQSKRRCPAGPRLICRRQSKIGTTHDLRPSIATLITSRINFPGLFNGMPLTSESAASSVLPGLHPHPRLRQKYRTTGWSASCHSRRDRQLPQSLVRLRRPPSHSRSSASPFARRARPTFSGSVLNRSVLVPAGSGWPLRGHSSPSKS